MSQYTSRSEDDDAVYLRAALAFLLLVLAAVAWWIFAVMLGESIGDTSDQSASLGIWLGIAVTLTVFSAATAVMSVVMARHNQLMRAVLTRSNA